jgi:hypothetical protein
MFDKDDINPVDLRVDDIESLTKLTNEYIEKFIKALDPRNYINDETLFIQTALTSPSMLSADIIDKVSRTFRLDRKIVLETFIDKLTLALKWVDHQR